MRQKPTPLALLALSIAAAFSSAAHAASNLPITDVTLYPDSATIGRAIRVTPGMTQLEVTGLPANFDTETIRVEADNGIYAGQVVTRTETHTEAVNARQAEINKKIQVLKDKEALLDVDAKSAALVQHYLETLNSGGAAERPVAVDGKTMNAMIDAIHHNANDAFERIEKVAEQKREIGEQINALQRDLGTSLGNIKDSRTITIALNVHQAGSLHLSYQINHAGWKPGYRASLDSGASRVDLERLATITQSTGEDWNNVTMTLATGHPNLSPQAPDPDTWELSYVRPEPPPKPAPVGSAYGGFAYRAPASAMQAESVQVVTAYEVLKRSDAVEDPIVTELQNTFATQFNVPSHVTLPADGREISVNLSAQALAVKQAVRIVPRIDNSGVLTASAARPDGVWLSGNVQLFRDGNYVGITQWKTGDTGSLVFPFGRDDLIRVKIDHTPPKSGSGGLLSQHAERHIADQYVISSAHKSPVDILVLESTPVSTSEEVRVQSAFLPKPSLDKWDDKAGIVGWQKTLAANEQMKISVDYDISYPKEGNVAGL
jgi:uncharacterized protein (TIGR02231 family)